MPAFTAWIDRNENRKVIVVAETAAHAREYATGRYGKVEKLKHAPDKAPAVTAADASRLRAIQDGISLHKDKMRRLRALGLLDQVGKLTDAGRAVLSALPPQDDLTNLADATQKPPSTESPR